MGARPALFALLLLCGCGARGPAVPHAAATPRRVMSMNQCTDQLVLALLPPERIASVTWLSRDPRFSAQAAAAARVPVNHGSVEEVVSTRPDLVVTDTFSNPAARGLLRRLGSPMIEIGDATDVAGIRRNVRAVAAAVDARARGEALIAAMDRALAARPARGGLRVAAWDRERTLSGPMFDIVLRAAGLRDVGGDGGGDIEALLVADPDRIVIAHSPGAAPSLADDGTLPPPVRARWRPERRLAVSQPELFCATPAIGGAAVALRRQVRARTARPAA